MAQIIYYLNDHTIELRNLKNEVTGDYLDAATVTVTLVDSNDAEVSGETWPLTMSYVTGSNGVYRATFSDTLSLTKLAKYTAKVTADGGAGLKGYWEVPLKCLQRT